MIAAAASTCSLSILAPCVALPSEGEEAFEARLNQSREGAAALLKTYQEIVSAASPVFILRNGDIAWKGDIEESAALQFVVVSSEGGEARLEPQAAMSRINWAAVADDVTTAIGNEHFLSTPTEMLRVFAGAVRDACIVVASGFSGAPVPLLLMENEDGGSDGTTVRFIGILLVDGSSEELPGMGGDGSCLLLDGEAEGRGLKEIVMSAAMLAMVFQSTASAGDARLASPQKTSWLASIFGGSERSGRGEVLKVTSQKLVQAPPRIYRNVLDKPGGGSLKVVVDIGDQRAYLVRGGEIAFETPISTAQSGRWTPRGTYSISEKVRSGKVSTIYNCPLPGWMRVGETAVGMHEGMLPGYPASHGCIRMPIESAHFIFDHAARGTTVQIVDSWAPPQQQTGGTLVAQN